MKSDRSTRRCATGLVRSLVVSAATLAILIVCFAIYQFSQTDLPAAAAPPLRRLPEKPTKPLRFHQSENTTESQPGVDIGEGRVIGPGEKLKITVYGRDSNRAQFEIEVDDLTPLAGSSSEFVLTSPEIRMRTKDGHGVRISADRGLLEARREHGGSLDPQRGKLVGGVVIQYDRVAEADRAKLAREPGDQIDPADLLEITTEEIEFDLEYSKLIVPGSLHLVASDAELWATDLEVRFNDVENRVEYMRISRGGKLDLREQQEQLGVGLPGAEMNGRSRFTLADWLRTTLEKGLKAQAESRQADDDVARATPSMAYTDDGIPIFKAGADVKAKSNPPVRYYAQFKGDVDVRRLSGGVEKARLAADGLEILREFSDVDRLRTQQSADGPSTQGAPQPTVAQDRLSLTWTERMVVEACTAGNERCGDSSTRVTAVGTPARLVRPGGEVVCRRLVYDPEGSSVSLFGTKSEPAVARFGERGLIAGVEVHTERHGDDIVIRAVGPGRLSRNVAQASPPPTLEADARSDSAVVEFTGGLEVRGRFVTRPSFQWSGFVSLSEVLVLDRATFDGRVSVLQDDTRIGADGMVVDFTSPGVLFRRDQNVKHVVGRGHVELTQQSDRVTCDMIDVSFSPDSHGDMTPQTAIALGDVFVERNDGSTIRAQERLIVDFAVDGQAESVSVQEATDSPTETGGSEQKTGSVVKRLRGFGGVAVSDLERGLDLTADSLDCEMNKDGGIETALVLGEHQRPATVRLDTFTVTGETITLNLPQQWAQVPGAGRLTFRSMKDLDGRRTDKPIAVAVTWVDRMTYRGQKNRSVFEGQVHATSQTSTTFDCDHLVVEFEDVAGVAEQAPQPDGSAQHMVKDFIDRLSSMLNTENKRARGPRVSKEPVYILATGHAVALTSEFDPVTKELKSRARIAGPRLSVNLRPEVSKMVIEGPGTLLLEENRPVASKPDDGSAVRRKGGLFAVDDDSGPSNTLIEWNDLMWYDFGINQMRFEGKVNLKHFSGLQLLQLRPNLLASGADLPPGRATYLDCDLLTVDFLDRDEVSSAQRDRRMGGLSADRLEQFEATGSVKLQDEGEGLSLAASRVVYWKDRDVLGIYGSAQHRADVAIQRPGELPNRLSVERLFYNLGDGTWELMKPALTAR